LHQNNFKVKVLLLSVMVIELVTEPLIKIEKILAVETV